MKTQMMWAVSYRDNLSVTTVRRLKADAIADFCHKFNYWKVKFWEQA